MKKKGFRLYKWLPFIALLSQYLGQKSVLEESESISSIIPSSCIFHNHLEAFFR